MLTTRRALTLNADAGKPLPRIDAFQGLYARGWVPRHGQVMMIVGRSGTQKSGLALFWLDEMNLPTLYFSADMSAFTASSRLASKRSGLTTDEVERIMAAEGPGREDLLDGLDDSNITFSFGSPITWNRIEQELDAYVELHDRYPEIIAFDNLMDFDAGESDYTEQMANLQLLTELARETGSAVLIMHHATDKSWDARNDPWKPPSRQEVKSGLSEKPEFTLSVALDPDTLEYRIACIKQRMGPCDPTARRYEILRAEPQYTRFHAD